MLNGAVGEGECEGKGRGGQVGWGKMDMWKGQYLLVKVKGKKIKGKG